MQCIAQVEIDKAARGVLAAHWPDVPRFEDVRCFGRKVFDGPVDLIAGGFPCQDVSVAGRRAGLDGKRSGLWWQFRRIVREFRPRWVVVENVPGLLSSSGGRDFAVVVRGLVKCRYRVAWRILDAQYFGLAQRRRRVFLVASLGNGCAAEVLFEPVGVPRDPAPGRKTWEDVAGTLGSSSASGGRRSTDLDGAGAFIAGALTTRGPTSDASCARQGHILAHPDPAYAVSGDGSRFGSGRENQDTYVFAHQVAGSRNTSIVRAGDYAGTLSVRRQDAVSGSFGVRRLTPVECERLQGYPDGWTAGRSDTARYRQLGNAVAVPVVEWIGRRLAAADRAWPFVVPAG
jgi:DNA (cytosine-5)-methyltransferase 1